MTDSIEPDLAQPPFNAIPGLDQEVLLPWLGRGFSPADALAEWLYANRWSAGDGEADELQWLCCHFLDQGDLDRAIETGDGAVVRLIEADRHDEADRLLDTLIARREDFALLHTRGLMRLGRGDLEGALQALDYAVRAAEGISATPEMAGEASAIHAHLAEVHLRRQAMLKALAARERARALAVESGEEDLIIEATLALARLYMQQGGEEEARESIQSALVMPQFEESPSGRARLWEGLLALFSPLGLEADLLAEAFASLAAAGRHAALASSLHELARGALTRETLEPAFCLNLAVNAPLIQVVDLAGGLLQKEADMQRPEAPLVAAATVARVEETPRDYPRYPHIHRMSVVQLITVARLQGIPEAAVKQWAKDERLYREDNVIGRCIDWFLENGCTGQWPIAPGVVVSAMAAEDGKS